MSDHQVVSANARFSVIAAIAAVIAFGLGNVAAGFQTPDPFPNPGTRPAWSAARQDDALPEFVPAAGAGPVIAAGPRRFGASFGSPRLAPAAGVLPLPAPTPARSIPAERFSAEGGGRYPVPQSMHVAQTSPSTEPGSFKEWAQAETDPRHMLNRMAILSHHVPRTKAPEPMA